VPNWLADPVACAVRLKNKSGCKILSGRTEVLSRSTRVYREVDGTDTIWRAGNISVEREGPDARHDPKTPANLFLVIATGPDTNEATPALLPAEAILASDVLRAAAVDSGGSACGGETILELMWKELMVVVDRLMTGQEAEDERDPGRAEGLAYAIAIMQNPYHVNWEAVRDQAVGKWEEENPE
jgi:hypothetical protein